MAGSLNSRTLYIGGTGRTGSTTVDQVLGGFDGVFSAGELAFFWTRGIMASAYCSCGQPIRECRIWKNVLQSVESQSGMDVATLGEFMAKSRRKFWSKHLPLMILPGFTKKKLSQIQPYFQNLQTFYKAIAEQSGAELIVDSSKEPHYSMLLRDGVGLDVKFLFLVRDPRATGFSWSKAKAEAGLPGGQKMASRGPLKSSLYYWVSNFASELLWRRHRDDFAFLRYEDFVADPHAALSAIFSFAGTPRQTSGDDSVFPIGVTHTSWGNPDRVGRTEIAIRSDERWKTELSTSSKVILTVVNLPLLLRYGYPLSINGKLRTPKSKRLKKANVFAYLR